MDAQDIRHAIYDFNFSYLQLAQRLINQDKALALFRLSIDDTMADTLKNVVPLSNQRVCL
ncbi:flagellar transcriptional regulator FlhD [Acerihabitans sp. TG2]|uniref:flagellar transcriptional regulator FlhD n=1 Tax=Acerihabitans sp. TG2 TaxID=3096008 RepID=UPI003A5997CE